MQSFYQQILNNSQRYFLPIGNYAGVKQIGATIRQAVMDSTVQAEAALATQRRLDTPVLLTGMDLSVEAEVFGCPVRFLDDEVPVVVDRIINYQSQINQLIAPHAGAGRTSVYLDAVRKMVLEGNKTGVAVYGGMIGPFSLAARLFGVSETLELSVVDPEPVLRLLDKIIPFLLDYASAFSAAGAQGVILAEPAAGLLSPRSLEKFSTPYVKMIVDQCQNDRYKIMLHNCGAKVVHLPKIMTCGAAIYHFGAAMDMQKALETADQDTLIGGNLDPAEVFVLGDEKTVREKTLELLIRTQNHPNFFLSSGCEIPPNMNLDNLFVCKDMIRDFNLRM